MGSMAQRAPTRGLIGAMKEKLVQIKIRKRLDPLPDAIESSLYIATMNLRSLRLLWCGILTVVNQYHVHPCMQPASSLITSSA
jgi:hypothetical protein